VAAHPRKRNRARHYVRLAQAHERTDVRGGVKNVCGPAEHKAKREEFLEELSSACAEMIREHSRIFAPSASSSIEEEEGHEIKPENHAFRYVGRSRKYDGDAK
jgi:hypothetical protein